MTACGFLDKPAGRMVPAVNSTKLIIEVACGRIFKCKVLAVVTIIKRERSLCKFGGSLIAISITTNEEQANDTQ